MLRPHLTHLQTLVILIPHTKPSSELDARLHRRWLLSQPTVLDNWDLWMGPMDLADIVLSVTEGRLQNSVLLPTGHRKLRQGGKQKIVNAEFVFHPVSKNNEWNTDTWEFSDWNSGVCRDSDTRVKSYWVNSEIFYWFNLKYKKIPSTRIPQWGQGPYRFLHSTQIYPQIAYQLAPCTFPFSLKSQPCSVGTTSHEWNHCWPQPIPIPEVLKTTDMLGLKLILSQHLIGLISS